MKTLEMLPIYCKFDVMGQIRKLVIALSTVFIYPALK